MAKRLLNRRELRKQSDAVESAEPVAEVVVEADIEVVEETAPPAKGAKGKAKAKKSPAVPKPKAPRVSKKKVPPRMVARWGVFDGGMKQLALFDFNQRAEAEEKLTELRAKKTGSFFLQIVKEPMALPAPAPAAPAVP